MPPRVGSLTPPHTPAAPRSASPPPRLPPSVHKDPRPRHKHPAHLLRQSPPTTRRRQPHPQNRRGFGGGFCLAREPASISLLQIIHAVINLDLAGPRFLNPPTRLLPPPTYIPITPSTPPTPSTPTHLSLEAKASLTRLERTVATAASPLWSMNSPSSPSRPS